MAFEDLTELIEPLELPIRGRVYRLPSVSLEDGVRVQAALNGRPDPDLTDERLHQILLGDAEQLMTADGVSAEWRGRAYLTAMSDFLHGRFAAEVMWKTGGDPKAIQALTAEVAPNRAARRKAPKQSPSTGTAGTTKQPASTSSTKASRKK